MEKLHGAVVMGMTDVIEPRFSYDNIADVLYISVGPKVRARAREDDMGIIWRVTESGQVVGATVQAYHRWSAHPSKLFDHIAPRLPVSHAWLLKALSL